MVGPVVDAGVLDALRAEVANQTVDLMSRKVLPVFKS